MKVCIIGCSAVIKGLQASRTPGQPGVVGDEEGYNETYRAVAAKEEFALFCEAVRCLPARCRRTV